MRYHVYSEDSEVIGHSILATVECLNATVTAPILKKRGLGEIDPEQWYPLQSWLDVFNDLEDSDFIKVETDVSIGMKIVETAVLPPEFDSMPFIDIIEMIDQAYKMNNRGTDIGAYMGEKVSSNHVQVTITAPYPDYYNYGILYGFAQRYLKTNSFNVYFDPKMQRQLGQQATVIHVEWE